jgi:glycerol uptake facilitator-like aquaporin
MCSINILITCDQVIGNCSAAVYCVKKPHQDDTLPLAYIGGQYKQFPFVLSFTERTSVKTGIAAMSGILVSLPNSGGHINPTVTIAFAVCKRMQWNKVFHYLLGQYIGSFLAQCIVWALFHEHIDKYDGGLRSAYGHPLSTGKIFTTFPPEDASLLTCIFDQVFCAWVLLVAVCAIIDQRGMKIPVFLQPFIISVFIAAMGSAMGFNAGGINPGTSHTPVIEFIPFPCPCMNTFVNHFYLY